MRMFLLSILIFTQMSCSCLRDRAFDKYVEVFEKACNRKVKSPIFFKKIKDNDTTVGRCYYASPIRYIIIDPTYWAIASENVKLQLILHELGHCELNRDHDERYGSFFTNTYIANPVSLMYPTVDVIEDFQTFKEYYLKELCDGY